MRLLSYLSWLAAPSLAIAVVQKPKFVVSTFANLPGALFYFEDSPIIMLFDPKAGDVWRSVNDGQEWEQVMEVKGNAYDIIVHPFDKEKAILFTNGNQHWVTSDKGQNWNKFEVELPISFRQSPMVFNGNNTHYALYSGRKCDPGDTFGLSCVDKTYYTKDWFQSGVKFLSANTHGCLFAHGNNVFTQRRVSSIFCIVDGNDKYPEHRKLLTSEDFFGNSVEPKLDGYNTMKGFVGLASVTKFLIAAVRSAGTDEMALYISNDATNWDRAEFPQDHGGLKEDAYTILESTSYSIRVDVLTTSPMGSAMGELFSSNSNGTYFNRNLANTNRLPSGVVDFERIKGIDGIIIANIVGNADQVRLNRRATKKLQSKISFHDGKMGTWHDLRAGNMTLHLHSVTELVNGGRVYSSRSPGLVMGVGNTGDFLQDYTDGDLYISGNAGLTWTRARKGAHKYEVGGSGSIIVAVYDEGITNHVSYSKDYGKHWEDIDLNVDIRARLLTTTPDTTSLRFLLVGTSKDKKSHIFNLDFKNVFEGRKCKLNTDDESKSDFEKWYARYDDDGSPGCLMGRKQYFWRRKKDADCYAGELFKEPAVVNEICKCQHEDFECDFNFVRDLDKKCVLAYGVTLPVPPSECNNPKDTYWGPSGYRKIPGNSCQEGVKKDRPIKRKCEDAISTPSTGKIVSKFSEFNSKMPVEYYYLENTESSSTEEETIIMMTENQKLFVSHDSGQEWKRILKNVKVIGIYPHPQQQHNVYFITNTQKIHYTTDSCHHFYEMDAPQFPNRKGLPFLDFHPRKNDWLIWHGEKNCIDPLRCHSNAYYTITGGEEWHSLKSYSGLCKWARGQLKTTSDKLIFCEHEAQQGDTNQNTMELLSSSNFFIDEVKHFDRIIGFVTMQEFIIVAGVKDDNSLKAFASVDGSSFADANFPHGFNVPHQTAYTVLYSVTHSVFLHVTVNDRGGFEYGSLLKSNSNGTNYVLSLDAVNRNREGFVDFEKMQSLEGVAIANRVVNWKDAAKGEKKKLRTMITHNDGGHWKYINPPAIDSEGNRYQCGEDLEKCSLNLHHYTERGDPRHTFSSSSAIGLMIAVGNVGDVLKGFADGDTFLTTDGGLQWKEIRKGQYLWEYGDQGSILVIVDRTRATDKVHYTLDEGMSWQEYLFGEKIKVTDISTVPADNSRRFLLWGYKEGGGEKFYTVYLDFKGITNLQCVLNEKTDGDNEKGDFFLWSPAEEGNGHCLFGHETQYHRKIANHRCYIGRKLNRIYKTLKNCTCTAEDFECDFNFERASDGTCRLVTGLTPPDHEAVCNDKNVIEYFKSTGYRRLPATTCQGGTELDKVHSIPCPGKEAQWKERHRVLGGFRLFMVIVVPFIAAAGIGYWISKRPLANRFGAIRLGEDGDDGPLIRYLITIISAAIALAMAIRGILSLLGSWVARKFTTTQLYTSRNFFFRSGNYSILDNDEGQVLGNDDGDEV
ncbi:Oligoxyloglucan reducing end-specific cellobiohydrolase [Wilcoxina mikolae CBS 423.85]|nr:Oligoxyloglucan reducing end-specific cellobiohydrolase [Wilcoxina mikolae CBS 423.85]